LSGDLLAARRGDVFRIGFEPGREAPIFWDRQCVLARSGAPRAPITLEAGFASGAANLVSPQGGAGAFFRNPSAPAAGTGMPRLEGKAPLRIAASHVSLAGFRVEGAPSDGFVKFAGPCADIHIGNWSGRSCGRVIETDRDAVLRDVVIENCEAALLVRGFARFRSLSHAVLRNLSLDAVHLDGGGENVCQIIAVTAGEDVTFENVSVKRAVNLRGASYAQGDGIVCERNTANFTFRKCHGEDTGDAAFDLKTVNAVLEDCTTRDCKFGARIWASAALRRCAFTAPRRAGPNSGACIEVKGKASLEDCHLQAGAGAAIFRVAERGDAVGAVRMRGGAIEMDPGATLIAGDPGGVVELDRVAVNGVTRTERIVWRGGMAR
jgi:hypothetical protein